MLGRSHLRGRSGQACSREGGHYSGCECAPSTTRPAGSRVQQDPSRCIVFSARSIREARFFISFLSPFETPGWRCRALVGLGNRPEESRISRLQLSNAFNQVSFSVLPISQASFPLHGPESGEQTLAFSKELARGECSTNFEYFRDRTCDRTHGRTSTGSCRGYPSQTAATGPTTDSLARMSVPKPARRPAQRRAIEVVSLKCAG